MLHTLSRHPWFAPLLIILIGTLAYTNSFQVPFYLDGIYAIVQNQDIRNLNDLQIQTPRYVAYVSFALNYKIGGLEVAGYHAVNLVIHLLAAVLVYALLRMTLRTPYFVVNQTGARQCAPTCLTFLPLFVALVFVVHPIQTQAVTYIVQRMTSMAGMFYLLALVLYVQARLRMEGCGTRDGGRTGGLLAVLALLAGATLSAVLAMKTKEIAFTLPLAVVLYEVFFFFGSWKKRLFCLLPILATLPIVPLSVMATNRLLVSTGELMVERSGQEVFSAGEMARDVYLFTQFRVILTYLRLLFLPIKQNLDYEYPIYNTFFSPPVFISFLVLAGLVVVAVILYFRSRMPGMAKQGEGARQCAPTGDSTRLTPGASQPYARLISFGIFWFFLTLSVESSFVPIQDVIVEHRLYLPSFGFFLAVSVAFLMLVQRFMPSASMKICVSTAMLLVPILAFATYQRNHVWGDSVRLWQDVVTKAPGNARAYNDLGAALNSRGQYSEAIEMYRRAIELAPDHPYAYNNLGLTLILTERSREAIPLLKKAIGLHLRFDSAYINLAAAYNQLRMFSLTVALLEPQMQWLGERVEAHYHLGVAHAFLGNRDAAIRKLTIVSEYGSPEMANDLKRLLGMNNQP